MWLLGAASCAANTAGECSCHGSGRRQPPVVPKKGGSLWEPPLEVAGAGAALERNVPTQSQHWEWDSHREGALAASPCHLQHRCHVLGSSLVLPSRKAGFRALGLPCDLLDIVLDPCHQTARGQPFRGSFTDGSGALVAPQLLSLGHPWLGSCSHPTP